MNRYRRRVQKCWKVGFKVSKKILDFVWSTAKNCNFTICGAAVSDREPHANAKLLLLGRVSREIWGLASFYFSLANYSQNEQRCLLKQTHRMGGT